MGAHLYFLLPESDESPIKRYSSLIHSVVLETSEIEKVMNDVDALNDFMVHEDYERFYDGENLKAFLYPIQQLKELYPFKYERGIRKKFANMHNCLYSDPGYGIEENTHLAVVCSNDKVEVGVIELSSADGQTSCQADVRFCQDKKGVAEWFFDNRRPVRQYDYDYPKHGENGNGAWEGNDEDGRPISVLLGSKKEAENLLKKAIGRLYNSARSWCYDHQYERYMEYRNEHNNKYHSYHLGKDRENEIPKDVKNKVDLWK